MKKKQADAIEKAVNQVVRIVSDLPPCVPLPKTEEGIIKLAASYKHMEEVLFGKERPTGGYLLPPTANAKEILRALQAVDPGQYTMVLESNGWVNITKGKEAHRQW